MVLSVLETPPGSLAQDTLGASVARCLLVLQCTPQASASQCTGGRAFACCGNADLLAAHVAGSLGEKVKMSNFKVSVSLILWLRRKESLLTRAK